MRKKLYERIEVVYEDVDLVVVEKASGLITYPVERHAEESAIQLIRRYWKAQRRSDHHLYLLHRLDKDTSGLLVFAKTTLARESLRNQFEQHTVLRQYLAITSGVPRKRHGQIRTMLSHDRRGRRVVSFRGKKAITEYRVIAENPARNRALVACRLHTGRTHQIRIHLSHIGTPVVGDLIYGRDSSSRLALHAQTLGFIHPRSGMPSVFRSSLPAELKRLFS